MAVKKKPENIPKYKTEINGSLCGFTQQNRLPAITGTTESMSK
jgi:hypothetical protein